MRRDVLRDGRPDGRMASGPSNGRSTQIRGHRSNGGLFLCLLLASCATVPTYAPVVEQNCRRAGEEYHQRCAMDWAMEGGTCVCEAPPPIERKPQP